MTTNCYRFVTVSYFFYYFLQRIAERKPEKQVHLQAGYDIISFNTLVLYPAPISRLNWYGTNFDRDILWDRSNARFTSEIIESGYWGGEPESYLFCTFLSVRLVLC